MPYDIKKRLADAGISIPKDFKVTENTRLAISLLSEEGILNQECFDVINCGYSTDTMNCLAECLTHLKDAKLLTSHNEGYFRKNPQSAGIFAYVLATMVDYLLLTQNNFDRLCSLDVTQAKMTVHIMTAYLAPTQGSFDLLCSHPECLTDVQNAIKIQLSSEYSNATTAVSADGLMRYRHDHKFTQEKFSSLVEEVLAEKAAASSTLKL